MIWCEALTFSEDIHNYILIEYNLHFISLYLQAPEELCAHACSLQLDWHFLHQILKLYSAILQETQKEAELLPASDQKCSYDTFFTDGTFFKLSVCAWEFGVIFSNGKLCLHYSTAVKSPGRGSEASEGSDTKSPKSCPTLWQRPFLWCTSQSCNLLLVSHNIV